MPKTRRSAKRSKVAIKKETYKRIKVAGMLTFIPFVLAAGALTGYFAGGLLKKFSTITFAVPLGIGIGLSAAIFEVVKIIRKALKAEQE